MMNVVGSALTKIVESWELDKKQQETIMLTKDINNLFDRIEACMNDVDDTTSEIPIIDWECLRHDLEKWPLGEPDY